MNIVRILEIIAEILKLLAKGLSLTDACGCAASMFNISFEEVENIWNHWGL